MDQSAFRSLLSSTSTNSASTSSSSSRPKFGAPPPKPSVSSTSGKPTDFKPRPQPQAKKKEFNKKKDEGGGYRDRAAERRAGKAGDFGEAEKLLEEFEERGKEGDDEEDRIKREEQRKYLGGDATHSILVKGLDMALLNQEKAKLSQKADQSLQDVEQQLDEQFEKPVSSSKKEKGKGKGKSRDDLLRELKATRQGGGEPGKLSEPGLGKGWKKLGAPEAAVKGKGFAPVGGGEKKLRKKKKKVVVEPPLSTSETPTASTSAPVPSGPRSLPVAQAEPIDTQETKEEVEDDDYDDDIFGDAGDYKGLESDSSSSSDESKSKPKIKKEASLAPPPVFSNSTKRKYFDDEEDAQEEEESISTAPSSVADLASRQALHSQSQPAQTRRRVKREDSLGSQSGSESEEEGTTTMGKLQPLSGSGPNVSELLKFDKLAQEEEERKAKKQKRKLDKEEKELSRADKDNRDYLQMEAYLEKKKNGGVTPERKRDDESDMREGKGMYADI